MTATKLFRYELRRVLDGEDCPLCVFARQDDERYLRGVLSEGLSNSDLLDRLSASGGFCRDHAWRLQRLERRDWHDGLTNACFARPLLTEALASLETLPEPGQARKRRRASRETGTRPPNACPACAGLERMQRIRAADLASGLEDQALMASFAARKRGLCLPHFKLLWRQEMTPAVRAALRQVQQRQLQELLGDLDQYLRKHHWHVKEEPSPQEESSWRDAVAMLSGDIQG